MPLETGTYISDLTITNPAHADGLNNADGHMRLIKAVLKNTFPNINGAVSATDEQLNAAALQSVVSTGPDGTISLPAYSFASEATLGFYRSAAAVMSFTGTLRGNGAVPAGAIQDFGMATAPTGWLACDGQAVSRTTYADLFAAIGTTWGAGDGSTTFNVPPLPTRYRRHRDNSTLSGAVGNLQNPDNLSHTHGVSGTSTGASADHTHTFSGTTGAMNANASHTHGVAGGNIYAGSSFGGVTGGGGFSVPISPGVISLGTTNTDHGHAFSGTTGGESVDHSHNFSVTSAASGGAETRPYSATVLTCIKI